LTRFPLLSLTAGEASNRNLNIVNGPLDKIFLKEELLAVDTLSDLATKKIRILFLGDVMPMKKGDEPRPHPDFYKFIDGADLVICNIESPM
jgi:hypothetical protein